MEHYFNSITGSVSFTNKPDLLIIDPGRHEIRLQIVANYDNFGCRTTTTTRTPCFKTTLNKHQSSQNGLSFLNTTAHYVQVIVNKL